MGLQKDAESAMARICEHRRTKRTLIINTRKRQLKYLGYVKRKESLENLIFTGLIEGKRNRGKHHIKWLVRLSEWMAERGLGEIIKNAIY